MLEAAVPACPTTCVRVSLSQNQADATSLFSRGLPFPTSPWGWVSGCSSAGEGSLPWPGFSGDSRSALPGEDWVERPLCPVGHRNGASHQIPRGREQVRGLQCWSPPRAGSGFTCEMRPLVLHCVHLSTLKAFEMLIPSRANVKFYPFFLCTDRTFLYS